MKLTEQQQRVVDIPLGNLLVSAAAGSGKTRVLVERIARRVIEGRLNVRNVLVMTFTSAAAAHMGNRLESALIEAQAASKDPREIRRISDQISLLPLAHISTIHSFCNDVIKNYGSELTDPDGTIRIEPGSSILDGTRSKLLLEEAVDRVLDELYALCHRVLAETTAPGGIHSGTSPRGGGEFGSNISGDDTVPELPPADRSKPGPFALGQDAPTIRKWCGDFMQMTLSYSAGRTDKNLREMILFFHSALRSLPDYEDRIREMIRIKRAESIDFSSSETAETLISELGEITKRAVEAICDAEPMLDTITLVKDKKKNAEHADLYRECFSLSRELLLLLEKGARWDDITKIAVRAPVGKLPGSPDKGDRDSEKSRFFSFLTPFFELMYILSGAYPFNQDYQKNFKGLLPRVFVQTSDRIQAELGAMYPLLSRLFETVILTDRFYSGRKHAENALDYSDQEQLALRLLNLPGPSEYYRNLFSEIYIDEYQDNSRIQDAIIARISDRNVFYVGDVKQSIYRFRHARPDMFIGRSDRYREGLDGTLLELNGNFRSRPEILFFVNDLFAQLMSRASGEIAYDTSQRLDPMRTENAFPDEPGEVVQLVLLEKDPEGASSSAEDEAESADESFPSGANENESGDHSAFGAPDPSKEGGIDLKAIQYEGLFVLRTIRELMGLYGCRYSDFAVLTRTNHEASEISSLLESNGVPAQGPAETALFEDRELLLMNNLILLIDNMQQDIPLCSVMRADFPAASFSPEELLCIYVFGLENQLKNSFFHEKVTLFSRSGPEPLRGKVQRFVEFIDELRTKSMYLKVSELIEYIYRKTGMTDRLSGQDNGPRRVAALETFREWANTYENGHRGGLYSFVRYIEEIHRGAHRPEDFEVGEQLRNTVRCNSIHKSKGLEYKIVFVCGLSGSFNREEEMSPVLLHDRFGIASDFIHLEKGYSYPTVPKMLLTERERRASLSEYMRLLYVALTRAEERLYLVASFSRKKEGGISGREAFLTAPLTVLSEKLPPRMVMRSGSFIDFLLLGLARNPAMPVAELITAGTDPTVSANGAVIERRTKNITVRLIKISSLQRALLSGETPAVSEPVALPSGKDEPAEPDLMNEEDRVLFDAQMNGAYAYENLIRMPAKTTVSEMKRRAPPPEEDDETRGYVLSEDAAGKRPINLMIRATTGKRAGKEALTPAEAGILLHSVFQYLDFSALPEPASPDDVRGELKRMAGYDMIRSEQLPYLEQYLPDIASFSSSEICARMKAAERKPGCGPFREIPFSITEPVASEDFRLIQGMIDCWFIENDSAVLVDYKSDRIRGDRADKERVLKERYSLQLDCYARAIEAASGLNVTERLIWLIPEATSFSF